MFPLVQLYPWPQAPLIHPEKLQKHGMHKGGKRTCDCRAAIGTRLAICNSPASGKIFSISHLYIAGKSLHCNIIS
jgi:hypothetical protein